MAVVPTKSSQLPFATIKTGVILDGTQGGANKQIPASLFAAFSHAHTASQVSDLAEAVQDIVGAMVANGSGITAVYNDAAGTLTLTAAGGGGLTTEQAAKLAQLDGLLERVTALEQAASPPDVQFVWSTANKSARMAVAGDTVTLTNTTGAEIKSDYAYGDAPIPATGKWVVAFQTTLSGDAATWAFGFRDLGFDFNNKFGWSDTANAFVVIFGDGDVHTDGTQVGEFQANQANFSDSDLILAGDSTARKFWVGLKSGAGSIRWNIDSGDNPATGAGGYAMPASFDGTERLFFQIPFTQAGAVLTAKILSKVADIAAAYPDIDLTGFSSLGGVTWGSGGGGSTPVGNDPSTDPGTPATSYTATQLRSYNFTDATTETTGTGSSRTMRAHDLWGVQGFNCKLDEAQHYTDFDTVVLPRILAQNPGKIRTVIPIRARQGSDAAYQLEIARNRAMCAKGAKLVINALTPLDLEPDRVNDPQTPAQQAARAFQLILDIGPEYIAIVEGMNEVNLNEQRFDPAFTQAQKGQRLAAVHRAAFQLLRNDSRTSSILVAAPSISGDSDFWEGVVNGLSDAYDLGNLRWYQGTRPAWTQPYGDNNYGSLIKFGGDTIANSNGKLGMVITETGYHNAIGNPTAGHRPVAERVARAYEPLISPWALEMASIGLGVGSGARAITKYSFRDIVDNINEPEMSFGLMRYGAATMKPAADAARRLANLMYDPGPKVTLSAIPTFTVTGPNGAQVLTKAFKKKNGKFLLILWDGRNITDTAEPGGVYNVNSYTYYNKANATLNIAASDVQVYALDPAVSAAPVTATKSGNNFTVPGFGQDALVLEITV